MQAPLMQKGRGAGVQLQLAVWPGEGARIVGVHGLTANCRCWDRIASALAPRHQVTTYDLRGRGLSEKPDSGYSERRHARDLLALLDDLGLQAPILMGHSLGGYIAMGLAAEHPQRVKGLVLMDAGGDLPQEQWDKIAAAIAPSLQRLGKVFASTEAATAAMRELPFLQPWSPELETYCGYDLKAVEGGVRSRIDPAHIAEEVSNKRSTGAAQFYPKLTCPVLILRATEGILRPDDLVLPEAATDRMTREIAHARSVSLPGTNHYSILFNDCPERDRALLDFIERCG